MFVNVELFSEAAKHFIQYGRYCDALIGTLEYDTFWDQEEHRCKQGYKVGDVTITGEHYFYLNYCPIQRTLEEKQEQDTGLKEFTFKSKRKGRKGFSFPDFWDGDYDYFWHTYIAENGIDERFIPSNLLNKVIYTEGGKFFCAAKARRKGFSFKNACKAVYRYTFQRESLSLLKAFHKKYLYPKGTFTMANHYSNFLNIHTDFRKRRLIDKLADGHIKSGYKELLDGIEVEKGYLSEIMSITFQDNPDAARGKSAELVIVEEAGDWPAYKDAYYAIEPCVRDGDLITGFLIMFGTGGDMTSGTKDFKDFFNNPTLYNMYPFEDVWENQIGSKGYFFPAYLNYVGHIDKNGNSNIPTAKAALEAKRQTIRNTAKSPKDYIKHTTEWAWTPSETFQVLNSNIFPTYEISQQLKFLESHESTGEYVGTTGKLEYKNNLITFIPEKLYPVSYPINKEDGEGCLVVWEHPVDTPIGLYVIGVDPYAQDEATTDSFGSVIVYKRFMVGELTFNYPVAEYTARPKTQKEFYEVVKRLAEYYNCIGTVLHENNFNGIKDYFEYKKCLHYLSSTPNVLKATENSKVNRSYGLHMIDKIKKEIEIYVRDWLLEEIEPGVTNVNKILSIPLLKELLSYNSDINTDRVIAFMLCLVKDAELNKLRTIEKKKEVNETFFQKPLFKR